jgi:hypothetical protein
VPIRANGDAGRQRAWRSAILLCLALVPTACFRSRMLSPPKTCPADNPNCNVVNPVKHDAGGDAGRDASGDGWRDGPADLRLDGTRDSFPGGGDARDGARSEGPTDGAADGLRDGLFDGPRDLPGDGARDGKPDGLRCAAVEDCSNGVDDDCNGLVDCFDKTCQGDPACVDHKQETCTNGIDDDGNGLVDCKDPACFGDKACATPGREVCNNNLDDDGDGYIDCKDPDCTGDPSCVVTPGAEICDNGKDDNGDRLVDCSDPQCKTFAACLQSACTPDVDFGAIAASGTSVTRTMATTGSTASFATCASPGGVARVGSFNLAAVADVRLDFSQAAGAAHVVALFRAGVGQACDQNSVDCLKVGDQASATTTYNALAPGNYWLVVQSFPGTSGSTTVTLSTGKSGATEICDNGIDDDGDGAIDCADHDCAAAPTCNLCVPDLNLGTLVLGGGAKTATVDTSKGQNRYHPSSTGTSTGKDIVVQFSVPETAGLTLDTYQISGDHGYSLYSLPTPGEACDTTELGSTNLNGGYYQESNWTFFPAGTYLLIFKAIAPGK